MKFKKFFSLVFTLALILTMTFSVLAQDDDEDENQPPAPSFQSTAIVVLPVVEVDIPTSAGTVVVNPYSLSVNEDDSQIISTVQTLTNRTPVPLNVSLTVAGSTTGDAVFSDSVVSADEAAKKIFVYLIFKTQSEPGEITKAAYDAENANHVLVSDTPVQKTDFITINAAPLPDANYLSFQAFGNCAGNPTENWTSDDTVGMTLAFSFKMLPR